MGYIAPINNYQYNHYSEMEIIKKYDPYRFVPINSIKPAKNPPKNDQTFRPIPFQTFNKSNRKNQLIADHKTEKIYGDITGKGLLFSDYA